MSDTTPTPPIHVFHSIAAAEEAYRAEVQRNEVFSAKFDVLGAKLDRLTTVLERLSTAIAAQPQPSTSATSLPPEDITAKLESTPAPALTPPPPSPTSSGLRELQLPRSLSDPIIPRREYIRRDRSRPPPDSLNPRSSVHPITRQLSPVPRGNHDYRGLSGAKLPAFHGRYTENVNAWLILIEDRFRIAQTPEHMKIASISSLFHDDALTWYLWIRSQYPHAPTWEEFKKELRVKFADSPVRTGYLRKALSSIKYSGNNEMEKYISQFRSIEIQISYSDMTLGDKLEYFIRPFELSLQRFIKKEHPNSMEIAYDMALDWATVYSDSTEQLPTILPMAKATTTDPGDDLNVLNLNAINMDAITCHKCKKQGHFARNCRSNNSGYKKDSTVTPHRRYKVTDPSSIVAAPDGRKYRLVHLDPDKPEEQLNMLMDYEVASDDSALMDPSEMYDQLNYGEVWRHYNDDWPDEHVYVDSDTSDAEMEYGYG
jgi:hypothetical protein